MHRRKFPRELTLISHYGYSLVMKDFIFMLREKLNMSQAVLAKIIGVAQGTIASWETGHKSPSAIHIKRIIKFARKRGINPTLDDIYPPDRKGKIDKSKKKNEKEEG